MTLNEHIERHYYYHEHKQYSEEELRFFRLRRTLMRVCWFGECLVLVLMFCAMSLEYQWLTFLLLVPFAAFHLWAMRLDPDKWEDLIGS